MHHDIATMLGILCYLCVTCLTLRNLKLLPGFFFRIERNVDSIKIALMMQYSTALSSAAPPFLSSSLSLEMSPSRGCRNSEDFVEKALFGLVPLHNTPHKNVFLCNTNFFFSAL